MMKKRKKIIFQRNFVKLINKNIIIFIGGNHVKIGEMKIDENILVINQNSVDDKIIKYTEVKK
mgnify:CR=1 FL=1